MFLKEFFGLFSLSAFSIWGLLMAFLFNVFIYFLDIKRRTTLLPSSFILLISYSLSDYFFSWLNYEASTYLDWALQDYATIFILYLLLYKIRNTTPSFIYLIVGLSINSALYLLMYYDIFLMGTREPWILWDIYSFGVNIVDLTMIVALIVDRDILGLNKLVSVIKRHYKVPIRLFKGSSSKFTVKHSL